MSETLPIFRHAAIGSPLGRVTAVGFVRHEAGGGLRAWRVYGRYALVYLLGGTGRYADTRGVRKELLPGDLVVVRPDLGHTYGPALEPGSLWHEYYLSFDGPVFDLWASGGLLLDAARPVRHLEPIDAWLARLSEVAAIDDPLLQTCRLQQLCCDILAGDTSRPPTGPGGSDGDRWLARARLLLDATDAQASLAATARRLGLSIEGFRRRFTRLAGQPPSRYRLARRIDRACELLGGGRVSIKEAAEATGFCDEFHFSRRFKQITGESPSRFRQRVRASGR